MTRDSIIDVADKLSEKKGPQFDLQNLYQLNAIKVCKANRFWWRKKFVTFNLVVGTTTYDLTAISTTPTITETGFEEIVRWSLVNPTNQPVSPSSGTPLTDLTPIFDDDGIFTMLENTSNSQPGRYVMGVDALQTLRIDPPDQNYKTRLTFWAIPNFADDSSSNAVPLIPPWHHYTVAEGIAADVLEFAYGAQDPKSATMRRRFDQGLIDMQMRPRYTTDYTQQFQSTNDPAIQST